MNYWQALLVFRDKKGAIVVRAWSTSSDAPTPSDGTDLQNWLDAGWYIVSIGANENKKRNGQLLVQKSKSDQ